MKTNDVGSWFKGDTLSELVIPVRRVKPDGTKEPYPLDGGAQATLRLRSTNRPGMDLEVAATIDGDGLTGIVRATGIANGWTPPQSPAGNEAKSPVIEKFIAWVDVTKGGKVGIATPILSLELVALPGQPT